MNSALERLLGLRVEDVMNGEVAALSEDLTMAEAAKALVDQMVSVLRSSTSKAVVWEY